MFWRSQKELNDKKITWVFTLWESEVLSESSALLQGGGKHLVFANVLRIKKSLLVREHKF
jgi:hypothetical protein